MRRTNNSNTCPVVIRFDLLMTSEYYILHLHMRKQLHGNTFRPHPSCMVGDMAVSKLVLSVYVVMAVHAAATNSYQATAPKGLYSRDNPIPLWTDCSKQPRL